MSLKRRKVLKLILLGDPGTGKTSLIQRYVHGKFKHSYQVTIGLDVSSKDIALDDNEVRLSINDIGGQDRFVTIRHLFYPGAHLAMLVYDCTRPKSLENLMDVWLKELDQYNPPKKGAPKIQKVLVCNKIDLTDLRSISEEEGDEAAKKMGCNAHLLVSAKENKNVDNAFTELTKSFLKKN
ncbi:MAG: GTPase KRas precursor [Candidatus Heimdallarchaeota archaeon LC_3]|nr:MAG: GTPase KRas precursor [Candidatus Heimdallarchaeota archaeon LC_3]